MSGSGVGWRGWLAGGVFLALAVGGVLLSQRPEPPPTAATPAPVPTAARPRIAQPPPPLGRADLIEAADLAAARYAAGDPPANTVLAGRRFALNLPFGCGGPTADLANAASGWTLDEETGNLRVKVVPEQLSEAPFLKAIAGQLTPEAAEGFWIDRPWSRVATCPSPSAASTAVPDRQTLALVEIFAPGTRRTQRRGDRAYETVATIDPAEIDLRNGLRLRVEGRLAAFGDGPPIGCWSETPQRRPTCAVSVRFERIAITDASGSRVFAEWTD